MNFKDIIRISENKLHMNIHVNPNSSISVFPAGYNRWRKSFEIKIKSKAIENKANFDVINTISSFFQIPTKNITIISGQKRKNKVLSISSLDFNYACSKIKDFLK